MLNSTVVFPVIILGAGLVLTSCGDGKPVEGEVMNVTLASTSIAPLEKRNVPLDIINGGSASDPEAFAAHLKTDGFSVETNAVNGFGFRGVTANKINHVDVPDFKVLTVTARKEKSDQDGGLTQDIRATFENGILRSGTWTLQTWLQPRQSSIIPYADSQKMTISENWANNILARYGLPLLKGEKIRAGLGIMVKDTRKDDDGSTCFNPDGSPLRGTSCDNGIEISYRAAYQLDNEARDVCWYGACQLTLSYHDNGPEQYRNALDAALANVYRQKFGEMDPAK